MKWVFVSHMMNVITLQRLEQGRDTHSVWGRLQMHTTLRMEGGRKKQLEEHICRLDIIMNVDYTLKFCVCLLCIHLYLVLVLWRTVVYTHVHVKCKSP